MTGAGHRVLRVGVAVAGAVLATTLLAPGCSLLRPPSHVRPESAVRRASAARPQPPPPPPTPAPVTVGRRLEPPGPEYSDCSTGVDRTDPVSVAAAVVRWPYCSAGPADVLTAHARQVVAHLAGLHPAPAMIGQPGLLDPRTTPVVVAVTVQRSGDPVPNPDLELLTMYRRPTGSWIVDDVAVVAGSPGVTGSPP